MKNNGYEESEKGMPFRGEDRQGKALRLMEALSGVDEELLERAEGGEARNKSRWRYAGPWAAVLCLAVVGALGWGGYKLTLKVNENASGEGMDNMAIEIASAESEGGAAPQEAGTAERAAGDTAAQKSDDLMSQENENGFDIDSASDGAAGDTMGDTGSVQHPGVERAPGMGMGQENHEEEASHEKATLDTESCSVLNQKELTEEEARNQEGLGAYIPREVPRGYTFESAYCNQDLQEGNLTVVWSRGTDIIVWSVAQAQEAPETVDIGAPETYDEYFYEIPHGENVPQEYRQSMDNPTFAREDFTMETVSSRMLSYDDSGDTDTPRENFSVLYRDNIVVNFNGRGTAEEIWEMFVSIEEAE